MTEVKRRKTDRRTLYTIRVIKDAFIKLVNQESYAKVTIAQICREADITRSTFYLHFNSITEVLNQVLDDALLLTQNQVELPVSDKEIPFDYLKNNESLIPACQRIGNSEKYQKLLMDPDLSEYIIGRIMIHERKNGVSSIMKTTGLNKEDAETLFEYGIHGSFAVNRAHHFIKDEKWSHDVQLLNRFIHAGYKALKQQ
ncbi:TetR/AcrR family transcriptional regulator [Lactobacillus sp. HT06-2]|uniref:TetR/AcrR family transcriptional regulator n=1 Tax=Lactobacillus sp. HT06-2 TaxID=2080222 RepID=UPI000CD8F4E9|nr:TetR/AcrR family transcriptional regulator [Lactobacillus sp. HT06-2]